MNSTKLAYLFEFPKFRKEIKKLNDIIFFFPFYHFGGGETVHLDILRIFKKHATSCFIIQRSDNDFLKDNFDEVTQLIDLGQYKSLKYESYVKVLAKEINAKDNPVVFGCNNIFFYRLLPFLDENKVKIIDLTHAFSYEDPNSVEKRSIPVVHKIHKRVILGKKTFNDYKNLYINNNIDLSLLQRFIIISNAVDIPEKYIKKTNKTLKVLFVSRNSFEKRPEIFFEIAKQCFLNKIDASFTIIGDFENEKNEIPNLKIVGSIKEKEKMNQYYADHDILLITSFREGFPMVILEGMAYGVVPISTNVGEISSFINAKNNNGILIDDVSVKGYEIAPHKYKKMGMSSPKNNSEEISEEIKNTIEKFLEIIKMFSSDREFLEKISKNAYNTVRKEFSKEKNKISYYNLFFESASEKTNQY